MCLPGAALRKRKYTNPEILRNDRDRMILRSFLVITSLLILGFVAYLLWFLH